MTVPTLYQRIGEEQGVLQLVTLFYDSMEALPEAAEIRRFHDRDLAQSREKLFQYFSGWFGGPPLFVERYGHPRLKARHKHIVIDQKGRDAWLKCLLAALNVMQLDKNLTSDLLEKIVPMADHMRNTDESVG